MPGKLIILEATDGSGKETQTRKLYERLLAEGHAVRKIEFPNYASDASALVKMYLNGDFGRDPEAVSPYVASTFFAVDRYASFKKDWGEYYRKGGIVLADRYTTANMVHQAAKIDDESERTKYLDWLWDFEFNVLGLPVPDCVVFLDMPPELSLSLIAKRAGKTVAVNRDIHEADPAYIAKAYSTSLSVARKYGWHRVACAINGQIRGVDEIHREVYAIVAAELKR